MCKFEASCQQQKKARSALEGHEQVQNALMRSQQGTEQHSDEARAENRRDARPEKTRSRRQGTKPKPERQASTRATAAIRTFRQHLNQPAPECNVWSAGAPQAREEGSEHQQQQESAHPQRPRAADPQAQSQATRGSSETRASTRRHQHSREPNSTSAEN